MNLFTRVVSTGWLLSVAASCTQPPTIRSGGETVNRERQSTRVALTFDDLPSNGPLVLGVTRRSIMAKITSTLQKHGVSGVTGFVNGINARDDADGFVALSDWLHAGNLLGNHTYSHPDINKIGTAAYLADIDRNDQFLREIDPQNTSRTFRFPFLEEGPDLAARRAIRDHLRALRYRTAEVTIDFADWAWAEPYARCLAHGDQHAVEALRKSFIQNAMTFLRWARAASEEFYGRAISQVLLLHVSAFQAEMLDSLLTEFEDEHATFVTLDKALMDPAYHEVLDVAPTWGDTLYEKVIEARHVPYPPFPLQPLLLLDAICR